MASIFSSGMSGPPEAELDLRRLPIGSGSLSGRQQSRNGERQQHAEQHASERQRDGNIENVSLEDGKTERRDARDLLGEGVGRGLAGTVVILASSRRSEGETLVGKQNRD